MEGFWSIQAIMARRWTRNPEHLEGNRSRFAEAVQLQHKAAASQNWTETEPEPPLRKHLAIPDNSDDGQGATTVRKIERLRTRLRWSPSASSGLTSLTFPLTEGSAARS